MATTLEDQAFEEQWVGLEALPFASWVFGNPAFWVLANLWNQHQGCVETWALINHMIAEMSVLAAEKLVLTDHSRSMEAFPKPFAAVQRSC
mmetsp:Transcript_71485/g.113265  ORF Transcript_71485/g.113265 Transcript_71485/m.113265 type:complete len:91 (+) Transcript_71485:1013-1285(+)